MLEEQFLSTLTMIHEAAFETSAWGGVLRRLADLTGCVAGGLTQEDPKSGRGTPITYFGFDAGHVERTFAHFLPMNPLFDIAPRMQPGFIVSNGDVVALDAFQMSDFYNGWARPQGLCCPITLVTHRANGRYLPLTLVKPDGAGDASEQDREILSRFAPHLIHAMNVTLRLQAAESRQEQLSRALECLSDGAVLADGLGRVVFVNEVAKALLDRPANGALRIVKGELVAGDPASDSALQAALATALGKDSPPRSHLVTIRQPGVVGQLRLNFAPLPYSSAWEAAAEVDGTGRPCCLILINDGGISAMARTYRLTPAETRLVEAIVVGKGLTWAARELGVSRSTAQSHLDNVFQKTGTNRQAELVALTHGGLRPC
jgi:DNA-binding CsgD family transcriptional regulator/PAS domain-containing protein